MKIATVNEFLEYRVQPEHREIVNKLRELMREIAPTAKEVVTYGVLGWRGNLMLAVINPTKKDITFSKGAEFEDKYGLLKGVGKVSKHQNQDSQGHQHRGSRILHQTSFEVGCTVR